MPVQLVSSLRAPVGWISSLICATRKTICSTFPNIKRYIDEQIPKEYEKCLIGFVTITKEAWDASE
jgi:hypothetical protein